MIHYHIYTSLSRLGRNLGVFLTMVVTVLLSATPAMANQPAPSGGGSVLNVLLLGLVAYFLIRAFRRRSGDDDKTRPGSWTRKPPEGGQDQERPGKPQDRHEAARQMWSVLSSEPQQEAPPAPAPVTSGGFDEAEFLEGAKLFFSRFQQARDSREFEELRAFISEDVYRDAVAEAQSQVQSTQARTEIMLLNAKLMDTRSEGGRTHTSVFYDAQLRKGAEGEQSVHVRAVWEFSRDDAVENGLWTLEKINKVDQ